MYSVKSILYGGPEPPKFSEPSESIGSIILRRLSDHGNKELFINSDSGEILTAKQVRIRAIRFAECLRYLKITENDVVGLCSENCLDFPVVMFATFIVGATLGPLNPTYTSDEIRHSLGLSKPTIIIASQSASETISKVLSDYPFIRYLIVFEGNLQGNIFLNYQSLLNDKRIPNRGSIEPINVDANRTILIVFSSGTTGLPKAVEMTKTNIHQLLCVMDNLSKSTKSLINSELRLISAIPWYHSFGMLTTFGLSIGGSTIISSPKYKKEKFLQSIQDFKGNFLMISPPTMLMLSKSPIISNYDLSSVKTIICGAAQLGVDIINSVSKRIPGVKIAQGYGLTETALSVLHSIPNVTTIGSIGRLRPAMWGKVIDIETKELLGPNEIGELCFKGDLVMKGYLNNETATNNTMINGWLHTGDIGYYTENEEWFICDRIKELIKFKGIPVAPAEIEGVLLSHPDILDAAVIGIPDENVGELSLGFVVKRNGSNIVEKDVIDFIASKISYSKQLHGGVKFISEIPKNPTGKIMRRTLKEMNKISKSKL